MNDDNNNNSPQLYYHYNTFKLELLFSLLRFATHKAEMMPSPEARVKIVFWEYYNAQRWIGRLELSLGKSYIILRYFIINHDNERMSHGDVLYLPVLHYSFASHYNHISGLLVIFWKVKKSINTYVQIAME